MLHYMAVIHNLRGKKARGLAKYETINGIVQYYYIFMDKIVYYKELETAEVMLQCMHKYCYQVMNIGMLIIDTRK